MNGQNYRVPDEVRDLNLVLGVTHLDLGLTILGEGGQQLDVPLREDEVVVRQRPESSGQDREEIDKVVAVADPKRDRLGRLLRRPAVDVQLRVRVLAAVPEVVHEHLKS